MFIAAALTIDDVLTPTIRFLVTNVFHTTFTNTIILLIVFGLFIGTMLRLFLIPQYLFDTIYKIYIFTLSVFKQQVGYVGQNFINLVFSFFLIILFSNYLGMLPFGFTLTSHIIFDLFFSFMLLLSLTFAGFEVKGLNFLLIFLPSSAPLFLKPLLVVIELVSYVARGFSLAIRLFANLMAGHALLNILCGFVIDLEFFSVLVSLVPFTIVLCVAFLEFGIAFIQAYVFLTLCCLYLKDVYLDH